MGISCHVKYYYHFEYIGKGYVNVITVFIIAGIVMMIAGILGIFCIVRKSYTSLMSYLIILAVLIILHFILGGLAFSYRSRVCSVYEYFISVMPTIQENFAKWLHTISYLPPRRLIMFQSVLTVLAWQYKYKFLHLIENGMKHEAKYSQRFELKLKLKVNFQIQPLKLTH